MTKLYGHPCRGGSVFYVLQDCLTRSSGMRIDRLCRLALANVEPLKSGNFMIFAKKTGLKLLRKIIMIFVVEFVEIFYAANVSILSSFKVLTVLSLKSSQISLFPWGIFSPFFVFYFQNIQSPWKSCESSDLRGFATVQC